MSVLPTTPARTTQWLDTPQRYGLVSRALHWSMALMMLWQFAEPVMEKLFGESEAIEAFFDGGPPHSVLGVILLALFVIRGAWGLASARRRGSHGTGLANRLAKLGHLTLYALMFLIPFIGLLRAYGSGRGWGYFGFQLLPATGERIEWMVTAGNIGHGELAWLLCFLMVGHIVMALAHHFFLKDDTLRRMAG